MPHPLLDDLQRLVSQVADSAGFGVVGVQIHTHRVPLTLLVQIRRADGSDVTLDDCAAFSGTLSEALDAGDLLSEAYVLEISSPGVGEELSDDRDFRSFRGFPVEVCFRNPAGAEARREGLLLERDDQSVQLNIRGRISRIPRADVLSVRLITPQA